MLSMRGKRVWVSLITVGLLVVGLYIVIHMLSAPAVGVVSAPTVVKSLPIADKTYEDSFVRFTYNGNLTQRPVDQNNGSALATYWFTRSEMTGWELSIQVFNLNGKSIKDDSSYNLRATRSDQYTQSSFRTSDGKDVTIFADSSGPYNKTAFVSNGQRYAVVSLKGSGANNDPGLVGTMSGVLNSWQWL